MKLDEHPDLVDSVLHHLEAFNPWLVRGARITSRAGDQSEWGAEIVFFGGNGIGVKILESLGLESVRDPRDPQPHHKRCE